MAEAVGDHWRMVRYAFLALTSAVADGLKAAVGPVDFHASLSTAHCTRG
ncbi:hypothetical protein [Streptomyces varsoviensis]|nr:hypothetical protein [Streptomyces varsoviensis]